MSTEFNTPGPSQVSIDETEPVVCDNCGEGFFQQALVLRKVSGILTGTGQTSYIPIPVFQCTSCNQVNSEFLPKEVQGLNT